MSIHTSKTRHLGGLCIVEGPMRGGESSVLEMELEGKNSVSYFGQEPSTQMCLGAPQVMGGLSCHCGALEYRCHTQRGWPGVKAVDPAEYLAWQGCHLPPLIDDETEIPEGEVAFLQGPHNPRSLGSWDSALSLLGHSRHLDGHTAFPYTGGVCQFVHELFLFFISHLFTFTTPRGMC